MTSNVYPFHTSFVYNEPQCLRAILWSGVTLLLQMHELSSRIARFSNTFFHSLCNIQWDICLTSSGSLSCTYEPQPVRGYSPIAPEVRVGAAGWERHCQADGICLVRQRDDGTVHVFQEWHNAFWNAHEGIFNTAYTLQGPHRCEWKVFTVRSHQLHIQLFESAVFCIILDKIEVYMN